jgi:octaprenyl-diphosphate synthase
MMELQNQGNLNLTETTMMRIIEKKTASLFAMACRLGGILADARPEHLHSLESFGLHLGTSFQLLDDVQDYLSGQAHTGKEPGRDLAEGKMTLPVLVAFRHAGTQDKRKIRHIISAPQREKYLGDLTTLVQDHEGFSYTVRKAEECVKKAVSAIASVPASEEKADIERAAWRMLRDNVPHRFAGASNP